MTNIRGVAAVGVLLAVAIGAALGYAFTAPYQHAAAMKADKECWALKAPDRLADCLRGGSSDGPGSTSKSNGKGKGHGEGHGHNR